MYEHTPPIETGKTYEVTHPWKGVFTLRVRQTDADFTAGCVVGGTTQHRTGPDRRAFFPPGSQIIVLNAHCTFRLCTGEGDALAEGRATAPDRPRLWAES